MPQNPIDVLVLGNAIVDVIARTDDDFLQAQDLRKGGMQLIDETRAESLYAAMGPATVVSGGSGANTAVGVAALGGRAAFIGKVRDDELGRLFAHDLRAVGVDFDVAAAADGAATARSFILVTPDGERTMNTYLGACQALGPNDVDSATVQAAKIVYLEGYLWDPPAAKEAFRKAVGLAHEAGNAVALTLSDAFCVDRYR
ncbi:MAG TPA: adenosine kinase, partial [Beijerinckiaceae bacterium]|nr:adenosine kinase [Beijerinckiaceae bacterium]